MGFVLALEVLRKINPTSGEDVRFLLKDFVKSPLGAHMVLTSASICTSTSVSAAEEHPAVGCTILLSFMTDKGTIFIPLEMFLAMCNSFIRLYL